MYDNLARLAALAHEHEVRRNVARPEILMAQDLRRGPGLTRRLLRTLAWAPAPGPCPEPCP